MSEPRTEAGRRLVEDEPRVVTGEHSMLRRVLAIEAEARAQGGLSLDDLTAALWNERYSLDAGITGFNLGRYRAAAKRIAARLAPADPVDRT